VALLELDRLRNRSPFVGRVLARGADNRQEHEQQQSQRGCVRNERRVYDPPQQPDALRLISRRAASIVASVISARLRDRPTLDLRATFVRLVLEDPDGGAGPIVGIPCASHDFSTSPAPA
jgi:hypothetical protein